MLPHSQRFDDGEGQARLEQCSNDEELILLRILRARHEHDLQLFSDRELARLRFLRWLVETGRLSPQATRAARSGRRADLRRRARQR
jgi:hypothetical protein